MDIFSSFSERKNDIDEFINRVSIYLTRLFGGNIKAGWVLFGLHCWIILLIYWSLFIQTDKRLRIIGFIVWLSIMLQHIYFNGCWLVRCERKLWNSKEWMGPWTVVFETLQRIGVPLRKHYPCKDNTNAKRKNTISSIIFALYALLITLFAIQQL